MNVKNNRAIAFRHVLFKTTPQEQSKALSELALHWAKQPNCGLPIPEGQPALVPKEFQ